MGERRKVLVLNHFAAPRGQAGGTRHVELFGRLASWDHLIIASDLNPQTGQRVSAEPGFAVVEVPAYSDNGTRRIVNWIAYAWRSFLLGLRQRHVDVVYGSSPHLLAAAAAWLLAALRRKPFVMEVRDLWPQVLVDMGTISEASSIFRALAALESFLYQRARAIVVMAEGSRTALVKRGVPAGKIHYIPNGADPEDFSPSRGRDSLRAQYGLDGFTAVYAGAHGPANGLDQLLDAADSLREEPITILMVGGGITKSHLLAEAEHRNLTNVRFMDPVPKDQIADLLHAADLGLHVLADVELFRTAVSPNKVFDYMAAGLPVLTNSPGLVSNLVERSGSGIAVAPGDLSTGLCIMAGLTSNQLEEMGARGREWVASNQSRSGMARRLGEILERISTTSAMNE